MGIGFPDVFNHLQQGYIAHLRFLQFRHLAIADDEITQMARGVVDGLNAIFKGRTFYIRTIQQRLADTGDGRCGIHHLMSQHPSEPFPRFYLTLVNLLTDGFTQLIQRLLHGSLTKDHAVCRHTEGKVLVADSLLHQMSPQAKLSLMADKPPTAGHSHYTYYYI